jgi:hypothetical protein
MIVVTITSGQPVPVPSTQSAASRTARLPRTSLRAQIHAERILASPQRSRVGDQRRDAYRTHREGVAASHAMRAKP